MLHELALAFAASTNFRTLLPRLCDALERHLPVVEVEVAEVDRRRDEVRIRAIAANTGETWEGARSTRYLERAAIHEPGFIDCAGELARVSLAEVAVRLNLPIHRRGLLTIAFSAEIRDRLEEPAWRELLMDSLSAQTLHLGWLAETADRCRAAHEAVAELEGEVAHLLAISGSNTDISVEEQVSREGSTEISRSEPEIEEEITDISVISSEVTEISVSNQPNDISVGAGSPAETSVVSLDQAVVIAISHALRETRGKIYGEGGAADLLGLHPSTLQSKMRKLGIERASFVSR